jgi:haloacetate dehalogenase
MSFFPGFEQRRVTVDDIAFNVRIGGSGSPLLLLHGYPQTHATWHKIAPELARHFTVVCPDLKGYGDSDAPAPTADSGNYSKRVMGAEMLALMAALGHRRFAVVGHDRGAYVATRAALDHAAAVERLAVLDGVPIGEALARADARFAASCWHWFVLGQTAKPAERAISADPDAWYRPDRERMGDENYEDHRRAIHDPETVHAMCEDYRAGLGIDREHDDADRAAGRRIACPVLFVWALRDDMEDLYGDPLAVWQAWADDVRGARIDCGHHMSEEAPAQLAAELRAFLTAPRSPR